MKNEGRLFIGVAALILGVLLLARTLDIITFDLWQGLGVIWPAGLILVGIAVIFRKKRIAIVLLMLTLIVLALHLVSGFEDRENRVIVKQVELNESEGLELHLKYGAGTLNIKKDDKPYLMTYRVDTYDKSNPKFSSTTHDGITQVSLNRQSNIVFPFRQKGVDRWDIGIAPNMLSELNLEYGAAEADIDLRELIVATLKIEAGATKTQIIFDSYPTSATIKTGASSIELMFPEGMGAIVDIQSAASSIDLKGFNETKKAAGERIYSNVWYDPDGENIVISIEAGATSIKGDIYG